jgi:hypothetical protein
MQQTNAAARVGAKRRPLVPDRRLVPERNAFKRLAHPPFAPSRLQGAWDATAGSAHLAVSPAEINKGMFEMSSTFLHTSAPYAATIAAGLVMVRLGSVWGRIESRCRSRWCASCHRLITGRGCGCVHER